jgi:hypothetical protein
MDIYKTTVSEFFVGNGSADILPRQLVETNYAPRLLYKGVTIRAADANTRSLYVGNTQVSASNGFELAKSNEVTIAVEDIHSVFVASVPSGDSSQLVTVTGLNSSGKFTLTFDGEVTTPLAYNASAATVQTALRALSSIGAGNVTVSGNDGGPYTVTFVSELAKTDVSLITGDCHNEVQTITITNGAAGDTLALSYNGTPIDELQYGATAAEVKSALEAVTGEDSVTVTSASPSSYVIEFVNDMSDTDASAITGTCKSDEVQTITISNGVTGDTYTLTYDGNTTAAIAYNATSATVQAALEAIDGIAPGDIVVTGDGPHVVTFGGTLANTDVSAITGVGGKNEVQTITISNAVAGDKFVLTFDGDTTTEIAYDASSATVQAALEALDGLDSGDVTVTGDGPHLVTFGGALANTDVGAITGQGGKNEVQTITISDGASGDTFTLTFGGNTTAPIAYNASSATVQAALEAIDGIAPGDVVVSGDGPHLVTFGGALSYTDVGAITGVGGKNEVQTITISNGVADDTYTLTFGGNTTEPITYNATSAVVQAALEAIDGIVPGDISVTGDGPHLVTFGGALANTDVGAISGVGGKNEVQTITLSDGVAGDVFTLTFGGNTTASIAYDATSATVQSALEAIDGIAPGDITVAGDGPHQITFGGALANTDVSAITGAGGKNEVQTITLSNGVAGNTFTLTFDGDTTDPIAYDATSATVQTALEGLDGITPGDVTVSGDGPHQVTFGGALAYTDVGAITGVASKNEKQTIVLNGVTSGTFTLTYSGQTTANINWNASPADVQDALEGLNNIGNGDVSVTAGDPAGWVVEFQGALANTDVAALTGSNTNLVGDPATITITETVKGVPLTLSIVETTKGHGMTVSVVETTKGNGLTVGVVETTKGHGLTVGVVETTKGRGLTLGIVETTKGHGLIVSVVETHKGNEATVSVAETIKGDADGTVVATVLTTASTGCDYSWVAC